jgi:threonine dehydrogenase-like Zn-dependent dehydrogenase
MRLREAMGLSEIPETAAVARLLGPGDLRFEIEPLVWTKGHDEILARTLWSAISPGTELAAFQGLPPLRPGRVYPRLMGYCNVAEVLAVGRDIVDIAPGARIVTWQSHRSAFVCKSVDVLAVLAPTADARAATATYLFHLGLDAVQKAGLALGHRVAVLGLGALGLGAVAMAAMAGAHVTAISRRPAMVASANAMGASAFSDGIDPAALAAATGLGGFDCVVTTSNQWGDWQLALQLARRGGTIAVLGFPGRGAAAPEFNPLESRTFYDKQLRILACGQPVERDLPPDEVRFTLKRNMAAIANSIAAGTLATAPLLTDEFPAALLADAYRALAARDGARVTAVLAWPPA